MRNNRRTILHLCCVFVLIALLVALPACGEKETTTKRKEKEIIKVGFLAPLTGGLASIAEPSLDAAMLAVEEINSKNLIPGKRLQLIVEDDACNPTQSLSAVQKLITRDAVSAIIGPICSPSVLADAPIVEQQKIVYMTSIATNPSIRDAGDYVFRNVPSDANQGVEGARLVKDLGARNVGLIYINNDWGVGMKDVFLAEAEHLDLQVTAETYEPSASDFRAQLTKIKAANPDAVYMLAFPAETGLILKQLRELGFTKRVVGADGSKDDSVIAVAGNAAEGLIVTLPGVPESPALERFAAAYKARYSKEYSAYTPETYDVTYIIAKACAATDCSSSAMKDYLYSMGSYQGASGTYEFDRNGEVEKAYDFFEVRNGAWIPYER